MVAAPAWLAQRNSSVSWGRGNKRPGPPRLPPGLHVCLMMSIIPVLSLEEAEQLTGSKNSLESWAAGLRHSSLAWRPPGSSYPSCRPSPGSLTRPVTLHPKRHFLQEAFSTAQAS